MDHDIECLLTLDGLEFRYANGWWIKLEACAVRSSPERPAGIKYSFTLHDPRGRRVYGVDNAHAVGRHQAFDHRHVDGAAKIVAYVFQDGATLLNDFYAQVERILAEQENKV